MKDTEAPATAPVIDEDIQEIVRENEAGVADLLEAYDSIEKRYFSAVAATPQSVMHTTTNTSGS